MYSFLVCSTGSPEGASDPSKLRPYKMSAYI